MLKPNIYLLVLKGPALPVEKKSFLKNLENFFFLNFEFLLAYNTPRPPKSVHKKSVQLFGRLYATLICECLVLLNKLHPTQHSTILKISKVSFNLWSTNNHEKSLRTDLLNLTIRKIILGGGCKEITQF